ncbi:MAG TPA: pantoate--beta-alanine ligase [Chitinophagaceae bacterium]|nr:pantoate--beta-alanine ligase [Chitinophagaceae bacterium]
MIVFKKANDLQKWLDGQQKKGKKAGFVPTMGALHPGHISLIEAAKKENDSTLCSIFVNPTQFNDPKDFEKYPVTIEKDIFLLEAAGCDVLFLPSVTEMYPEGIAPKKEYALGRLEEILEGKFRPGHYQGVCQVVERLLHIVEANHLYLGQKDYQQCMVITKLVELMGKKDKITIRICPTLRENDGLAMSSRNMRLNEEERKKATAIYRALTYIKDNIQPGETGKLSQNAISQLTGAGFKVDYFEIADAATLEKVTDWNGEQKLVALAAAFLNEIRLIDNRPLN